MSKFSNLYDIDGNIINKSPQHTFTLEETEKLVDDLTKKVEENPDNEVYKVYLNNAQKWLFKLYNNMSTEDLKKRISFIQNQVNEAQSEAAEAEKEQLGKISEAMEQLKAEYDKEEIVQTPYNQVETPITPDQMDEYVEPIAEVAA